MEARIPMVVGLVCLVLAVAMAPRGVAAQGPSPVDSSSSAAHVYGGQAFRLDGLTPWRRGGVPFTLFHGTTGTSTHATSTADDGGFLSALADALIPVLGIRRDELHDSWGSKRVGHRHRGIDILAPKGTPVVAAVDGAVLKMKWDRGGGRTLRLVDTTNRYVFYYAHLSGYARGLREGEPVRKGQVVGYVGRTGDARGAHLHLGIASLLGDSEHWWQARPLNPYTLLKQALGFGCDSLADRGARCAEGAASADTSR